MSIRVPTLATAGGQPAMSGGAFRLAGVDDASLPGGAEDGGLPGVEDGGEFSAGVCEAEGAPAPEANAACVRAAALLPPPPPRMRLGRRS